MLQRNGACKRDAFSSRSPSILRLHNYTHVTHNRAASLNNALTDQIYPPDSVARRQVLGLIAVPILSIACIPSPAVADSTRPPKAKQGSGDWSSPGLDSPVDDSAPVFFKTPSGVKVQQLRTGSGSEAKSGDLVLFDFVLRRGNGYFIYGTVEGVSFQPSDVPIGPVNYKLGDGTLISGLEEVLVGMQPGGKRRALIPPEVGYIGRESTAQPQPPTYATQRQLLNHAKEALLFEVQLLKVNGRA